MFPGNYLTFMKMYPNKKFHYKFKKERGIWVGEWKIIYSQKEIEWLGNNLTSWDSGTARLLSFSKSQKSQDQLLRILCA